MPSLSQWPSPTVPNGVTTKTIPPPLLGRLPSRNYFRHNFWIAQNDVLDMDQFYLPTSGSTNVCSQLHAIDSSCYVSVCETSLCSIASKSTSYLRSTSSFLLSARSSIVSISRHNLLPQSISFHESYVATKERVFGVIAQCFAVYAPRVASLPMPLHAVLPQLRLT